MSAQPASRVEVFDFAIPAGSTKAAPATLDTGFPAGDVVGVELVFPDGCSGLVGVYLSVGDGQTLPTTTGSWLLGNDETLRYDLVGQPNNGAWKLTGYNTDVYDHTVHVRFLVADFRYTAAGASSSPATLPALA